MVEEQHAVEVIDLVLHGPRLEARQLGAVGPAVAVQGFERHGEGALDITVDIGDGETALLRLRLAGTFDDLGIDEHERLLVDLDHGEPFAASDLRRGEPDAARVMHGLEHVGDEAAQLVGHLGDRRRRLTQNRVAQDSDVEDAHGAALTPW